MFLNIFNCIVFDEKMDLNSCINNEYLCTALTEQEMTIIIPLIADLMDCESLTDILLVSDSTTESLVYEFKIPEKTIETWFEKGISEYEKYSLTFQFASAHLEALRHHTCQICGADYFSKETCSDVCEQCAADIYRNFWS